MPWTGLAAAGASSVLNAGFNSIMANSANAKSKRAVLTQFAMQNYLMDKQNEYNKPINQMKRLREAGLNPNLVYGDGGATMASADAGSIGQANVTPATGSLNVLGQLQAIKSIQQQNASIKETEARTQAIDDNMALKQAELLFRQDYDSRRLALQEQALARGLVMDKARMNKINEELAYLRNKFNWENPNDIKKLPEIIDDVIKSFGDYYGLY